MSSVAGITCNITIPGIGVVLMAKCIHDLDGLTALSSFGPAWLACWMISVGAAAWMLDR